MQRFKFVSLLVVVAMLAGACQATPGGNTAGGTIKIVSSLPMTGSSLGQTQTIVNSIKMKLEEVNYSACNGSIKIEYTALDDATAAAGKWTKEAEQQNANTAVADADVMVYIGTFNSGAAQVSIPILNAANLVMISPANTYPGLTKPGKGEADEPAKYYPNGVRNYTRVVTADDVQGAVAANWAKTLGAKKVYILNDQELYGKGVADVFEKTATQIGLTVLGNEGIDAKASDYKALMTKIQGMSPDLIYYGGITQNNAGQLVKDMRAVGMTSVKFMGPDGIKEDAFIEASGADAAEGVYGTVGGVSFDKLPAKGQDWYKAYKAKYNSEPEAYAVYGYEAAQVALAALNKVCAKDREKIRAAVFDTKSFDGVLGVWSFDVNGDTSISSMTGYQVKNGKWEAVGELAAP